MLKKVPHTYVIIFFIIIVSAMLTWFIPGGEYIEKSIEKNGVTEKVLEFQYVDHEIQTWQIFGALFKGFEKQAGIIVFILMIGGAFWIMNSSKAIDVGILAFLRFTKKLERNKFIKKIGVDNLVITLIMLMFSIFGAVFGMSEETIAFIIIIVPLAITMGYDSITGVCMVFVAAGLGFAGAILNPFTIGIAQGLADIPLFTGIEYRMFCWLVINSFGIIWVLRYARKIKKNPEKSLVHNEDEYWRKRGNGDAENIKYQTPKAAWFVYGLIFITLVLFSIIPSISEYINNKGILIKPDIFNLFGLKLVQTTLSVGKSSLTFPIIPISALVFLVFGYITLRKTVHYFILLLLGYTILFLIIGVMGYEWYIMRIASLFFAMGIMAGISFNYGGDTLTKLFLEGVKDILSAAVVVGLAGGIIIILEEGRVIDSILYYLSQAMNDMGSVASVGIMYVIQTIINIIIPSGSAKAAITMPIMAPFSDLIGISRQATVTAFQFGDGFTNMITPTSGVLIAVLGVARIPYEKWVRWIGWFMVILIILGFLLLIPTVTMKLNGF